MVPGGPVTLNRAGRQLAPLLALVAIGATTAALALYAFAGTIPGNLDDSFILLVYIRHLLDHGGFFWNIQDGPVDGFSSFLDLLLKAAIAATTAGDLVLVNWATTVVLLALSPLVLVWIAWRARTGPVAWSLLAVAFGGACLATSPAVAYGAAFLLETPLAVLTALLAVVVTSRALERPSVGRLVAASAALLVVALVRFEGFAIVASILAVALFEKRGQLTRRQARALLGPLLGPLLGGLVVYFAWRLAVFGRWAPNTYYAKTSDLFRYELADGWRYLTAYAASIPGAIIVVWTLLAPAMLLLRGWPDASRRLFTLTAVAGWFSMAAVVAAGGDCYAGGRFMAVTATLACVSLAVALSGREGKPRIVPATLLLALLFAQAAPLFGARARALRAREIRHWPVDEADFGCERQIAQRMAQIIPGKTVAQSDFQRLKYFADDLRVVDLNGLNDVAIAHLPWPRPDSFGKFLPEQGIVVDAPAWIYGYRVGILQPIPLSYFSTRRFLTDHRVHDAYAGPLGGLHPQGQTLEAMISRYATASIEVCGGQFGFLLRRDLVSGVGRATDPRRSVTVGESADR